MGLGSQKTGVFYLSKLKGHANSKIFYVALVMFTFRRINNTVWLEESPGNQMIKQENVDA